MSYRENVMKNEELLLVRILIQQEYKTYVLIDIVAYQSKQSFIGAI